MILQKSRCKKKITEYHKKILMILRSRFWNNSVWCTISFTQFFRSGFIFCIFIRRKGSLKEKDEKWNINNSFFVCHFNSSQNPTIKKDAKKTYKRSKSFGTPCKSLYIKNSHMVCSLRNSFLIVVIFRRDGFTRELLAVFLWECVAG